MFQTVMDWLEAEPDEHEGGFDDQDIRISVAALFYHMVAVDGVVTNDEMKRLRRLLRNRYRLNADQLSQLARDGENSDKTSAGLFPFAVILNRELTEKQRQRVFKQLHALAMADGTLHPLENDMLDHMKVLLKIDP